MGPPRLFILCESAFHNRSGKMGQKTADCIIRTTIYLYTSSLAASLNITARESLLTVSTAFPNGDPIDDS